MSSTCELSRFAGEEKAMASIRRRNNSYHVQVRKKGYPTLTATFTDHSTALSWAKKVESEIDRGIYLDISIAQSTTVRE